MALPFTVAAVGGAVADRQEDPVSPAPAGLSLTAGATTTVIYPYSYENFKGKTYSTAP